MDKLAWFLLGIGTGCILSVLVAIYSRHVAVEVANCIRAAIEQGGGNTG